VKRYNRNFRNSHEMLEAVDGVWVKFEEHEADVAEKLAASQAEARRLRERLDVTSGKVRSALVLLQNVHGNELTWGCTAYKETGEAIDLLEDSRSALAPPQQEKP